MNTYSVEKFTTPPENQGQIVTVSYALADDTEIIIVRTHDASDNTTEYWAYELPEDYKIWDPWNGVPELGDEIGPCTIKEEK